jgi:hypothetical protein
MHLTLKEPQKPDKQANAIHMKTLDPTKPLRGALKRLALAVAIAAGLSAGSAQALTTTATYNLGTSPAGTTIAGAGASTLFVWVAKGSLPAGSILRSVTVTAVKLEDNPSGSWASDLGVFVDPTPETPGGPGGLLKISDDNNFGGAVSEMNWANAGQNDGPFTVTIPETSWTGPIDLHDAAVMIGSAWGTATWSGTVTVEYDISTLTVLLTNPAADQAYETGTAITASAAVVDPGNFTNTVTFHVTPVNPAGPTVDTVSPDAASPFTAALGALPDGTYEIYATTVNDADPAGTATSATHTFTVEPAQETTIVLDAAGPATTYGDNVTFTATVTPAVDPAPTGGTVQFLADDNYIGSPVAVDTVSGVATVSTTELDAGTRVITAEYSGYQIYESSTTAASISQEVGQAPLTVKALNTFRAPNTANPDPFPYLITGYQNGENLATSGVTGEPELTTDALPESPPGPYDITCAIGDLLASNYSFTLENGTLTVAVVANTFSVNFYFSPGDFTPEQTANILVPPSVPAGMGDWFTSGWLNFEVPFGVGTLPPVTVTSNQGATATFNFNDARNGWVYDGARTTFLGDGNYNMMDGHVNSTLEGEGHKFDMEMTGIPFATYDVIFYMGANLPQFGDGTGVIKFNGGAERAFKLKPGAFDGTFTEMVDATTEGNYIVFTNVTGSSFTTQTWGLGPNDFNHVGPFGFQIREVVAPGNTFTAWTDANGATGQSPDQDHDNDGVENGIEYFMGETGSSFTALPGLDGTNTVTWTMDPAYDGTYEVQTSPDLGTWTNVDPRPVPVEGNLSYLLPSGLGKQFVRLLVKPTLP